MPVHDKIIIPMQQWFGKDIPEGKRNVYYEILKFSDEVLELALQELKETWSYTSFPQPAHLKTLCFKHIKEKSPVKSGTVHISQKGFISFFAAAESIKNTPIFKIALMENWAMSLVHDVQNGKQNFDDRDIAKYREGRKDALERANTLHHGNIGESSLLNLWHTLQKKEQKLIDKYKYLIAAA